MVKCPFSVHVWCVFLVNGLWKEIPSRNWWTQRPDKKNAGKWEKGKAKTCRGGCYKENKQNGRKDCRAFQKLGNTKTGIVCFQRYMYLF